jgi:hypothetical protein
LVSARSGATLDYRVEIARAAGDSRAPTLAFVAEVKLMVRVAWIGLVLLVLGANGTASAVILGFVDDFSGPDTNGWYSFNSNTNPGTGGVGGAGDGYLLIASDVVFNFGTHNDTANYAGDWEAAGITEVSFFLNDVNAPEEFFFHFLLSGAPPGQQETSWQSNVGYQPPNGTWQQYFVDLTTGGADWARIRGAASFEDVLHNVDNAHFRHDLPPYNQYPDGILGDLGIDQITLLPEPTTVILFGLTSLLMRARQRAW